MVNVSHDGEVADTVELGHAPAYSGWAQGLKGGLGRVFLGVVRSEIRREGGVGLLAARWAATQWSHRTKNYGEELSDKLLIWRKILLFGALAWTTGSSAEAATGTSPQSFLCTGLSAVRSGLWRRSCLADR